MSNAPVVGAAVSVRPATLDDVDLLVDGNLTMARVTEGKTLHRPTLEAGVAAALNDDNKARYFVAEIAGEAVGQLMLTQEWSDWRNGTFWWIQSVFVKETARRRGVYRALHDFVIASARSTGNVCGVRLYVERDNATAIATYASLEMKECDYNMMEIMLDAAP